jgi:hypothetical protein
MLDSNSRNLFHTSIEFCGERLPAVRIRSNKTLELRDIFQSLGTSLTTILKMLKRYFAFKLNLTIHNLILGMQLPVPARLPGMCETPVLQKEQ